MYSIQQASTSPFYPTDRSNPPAKRLKPNLLPCSIKHSGPIPTSKRHWNPVYTTKITKPTKTTTTTPDSGTSAVKQESSQSEPPSQISKTEAESEDANAEDTTKIEASETQLTSTFRGRKLLGRRIEVPAGYEGVMVQRTDKIVAPPRRRDERGGMGKRAFGLHAEEDEDGVEGEDDDDEEGPLQEVKIMEKMGAFDEIVVWGHEMVPDDGDAYVKGLQEWIGFAEAVHSYDPPVDVAL